MSWVARLVLSVFRKLIYFSPINKSRRLIFWGHQTFLAQIVLAHMSIASFMRNGFHKGSTQNMESK